jgi:hypothetical protein
MLHRAILGAGAPLKVSEAARACDHPEVDLRLARVVLASSLDRFGSTDRRWTVLTREADPARPVERTIDDLLESYGKPLPVAVIGGELSIVYGRLREAMETVAARLLGDIERFAPIGAEGTRAAAGCSTRRPMTPRTSSSTTSSQKPTSRPTTYPGRPWRQGQPPRWPPIWTRSASPFRARCSSSSRGARIPSLSMRPPC